MNGALTLEVKNTLYKVCTGDQALSSTIDDRVYTYVPEDAVFPYIRITNVIAADGGTKTSPGQAVTVAIDVFSRERGDLILDTIMRRLVGLFHEKPFVLAGASSSACRFLNSFIQPDPDGITRHGVVRFRLNVYEDNP